jgi:hypothetical protein
LLYEDLKKKVYKCIAGAVQLRNVTTTIFNCPDRIAVACNVSAAAQPNATTLAGTRSQDTQIKEKTKNVVFTGVTNCIK